ncbi:hypothetical protein [Deinococcus marmoris]|uniref:hypothetical protein n=1 Tax=Deinococcus marmoris TaxID=249408 RepID=UPI000494DCBB|nr:hypothetical protein [Deinococcus marmoris]
MKKLLILPLLLLASCAPILQTVQQESASLADVGGAIIFANPGPETAKAPELLLAGTIETTDPNCVKRASGRLGCNLPDTVAGQQYRLIYTGKLSSASVSFYKASKGDRPIYLRLN